MDEDETLLIAGLTILIASYNIIIFLNEGNPTGTLNALNQAFKTTSVSTFMRQAAFFFDDGDPRRDLGDNMYIRYAAATGLNSLKVYQDWADSMIKYRASIR